MVGSSTSRHLRYYYLFIYFITLLPFSPSTNTNLPLLFLSRKEEKYYALVVLAIRTTKKKKKKGEGKNKRNDYTFETRFFHG